MPISDVVDYLTGALTVNEVTYPVPPTPSTIFLSESTTVGGGAHTNDEVRHSWLKFLSHGYMQFLRRRVKWLFFLSFHLYLIGV